MSNRNGRIVIQVDRYTRVCMTIIAVLLTVLIVGLWHGTPTASTAQAAGADDDGFGGSGARQQAILKSLDQTNVKLDELAKVLKSGEVKVQVVAPGGGDGSSSKSK